MLVGVVRRALLVVTVSAVTHIISRRRVCCRADVITAVVLVSSIMSTAVRGRRRACGCAACKVVTEMVGARGLLPTTVVVSIIYELPCRELRKPLTLVNTFAQCVKAYSEPCKFKKQQLLSGRACARSSSVINGVYILRSLV